MKKPCIIWQPNHFLCSIWTNIPYIYIRNFLLTGYCGATGQHQEQLTLQLKVRYCLRLFVWCLIKEVSTILCMLFFLCLTCRNLSSPYYIILDIWHPHFTDAHPDSQYNVLYRLQPSLLLLPCISFSSTIYLVSTNGNKQRDTPNRSDTTRTCALLIPNQAGYQLTYTPLSYIYICTKKP